MDNKVWTGLMGLAFWDPNRGSKQEKRRERRDARLDREKTDLRRVVDLSNELSSAYRAEKSAREELSQRRGELDADEQDLVAAEANWEATDPGKAGTKPQEVVNAENSRNAAKSALDAAEARVKAAEVHVKAAETRARIRKNDFPFLS